AKSLGIGPDAKPGSSAREISSSTRKTNFVLDAQTKIVSDVNRLFEGGPMFSKTISQKSGSLLTLFAAVVAALQFFTVIGLAQSTFGQFVGTVKDPSGAVIPGVMVTVKNLGTSATRTAVGDETGTYTVVNLEPGDYEITMEAAGFQ